jgi:hypothetical protein
MDIDIQTTIGKQFSISFGEAPQMVSGNRALLNRFEIIFLTNARFVEEGDTVFLDSFGGNAYRLIDRPQVLNDPRNISLSVAVAIEQTVKSILSDQPPTAPNTEKLESANLLGLSIVDGVIMASIQVIPVETQVFSDLMFNLPIITYEA